jgi:hypothetical protein
MISAKLHHAKLAYATNKPAFTIYDAVTCLIVVVFVVIATAPAWLLALSVMP